MSVLLGVVYTLLLVCLVYMASVCLEVYMCVVCVCVFGGVHVHIIMGERMCICSVCVCPNSSKRIHK